MKHQFLKNKQIQPWIWLRYTDDIFKIWTARESKLDEFLEQLINFRPNLKLTHECFREKIRLLVTVE